ncbi:MAG: iron-containing alcohol dehydrogenase [Rhodospirillales bacterium]
MNTGTDAFTGNWNYPTTVRFGAGRISELADVCRELGMTKPLLVTDPGLAGLDMVAAAVSANNAAGVPTNVFSAIKPNPVSANVIDGIKAFNDGGHDGVIAFGGGSALDAGKAVAFMAGQTRPIWDFEDIGDNWMRADAEAIAPVIAVPTTSGTGSETGRAAVVTNQETHTKKIIFHPLMMPLIVIADPELVVGLPAHLTAATGMDALAHCFEAYCEPGYHPMAEGIALEGMRLIHQWLAVAVRDGANIEARSHMMAASAMGSTAFQKGLGAIHSLSHPVGAVLDAHHGLANGVFFPYVMVFNRAAIAERMVLLARYLGLGEASFEGVLEWILELRKEIGIPHTADALGVGPEHLDKLSAMAAEDPTAPSNPVPAGVDDMRKMYEAALTGKVG